ncbi:MAG: hypothetical protein HRU04_08335 [Oceanospirillaceae bacterium]|nr:hypothetical protein [Oceanospirillaceae bacterium]
MSQKVKLGHGRPIAAKDLPALHLHPISSLSFSKKCDLVGMLDMGNTPLIFLS